MCVGRSALEAIGSHAGVVYSWLYTQQHTNVRLFQTIDVIKQLRHFYLLNNQMYSFTTRLKNHDFYFYWRLHFVEVFGIEKHKYCIIFSFQWYISAPSFNLHDLWKRLPGILRSKTCVWSVCFIWKIKYL
jgi:hypothetical protein